MAIGQVLIRNEWNQGGPPRRGGIQAVCPKGAEIAMTSRGSGPNVTWSHLPLEQT